MDASVTPNDFSPFEWRRIKRGDEIEVLNHDVIISRGVVDDFTFDRHVLWLEESYGRGRRMFHQQDGWQLRTVREAP